jgi:bifunctional ADP-heptose synthase (sugar kinase/adenylyltransferase)
MFPAKKSTQAGKSKPGIRKGDTVLAVVVNSRYRKASAAKREREESLGNGGGAVSVSRCGSIYLSTLDSATIRMAPNRKKRRTSEQGCYMSAEHAIKKLFVFGMIYNS